MNTLKTINNKTLSYDRCFHFTFSNPKVLSSFLTLLWDTQINEDDIVYLDPNVITHNKETEYDIYALIRNKDIIRLDLEMQNYNMENYSERFQIYQARLQNSDFEAKKKYNISSCISIWICNFESDELADCFLNYITLKDKFNRRRDKFKYEVQEINLKYLDQCPKIELKEAFQYFILPYDEAIELEPMSEFAKEMKNLMFKYNLDEEAKKIDEWRALNAIALENTLKEEAEEARRRNIKLEEETNSLKTETKQLKENTKNMILLMHKNNISLEDISKVSNLSVEEVKKIINE